MLSWQESSEIIKQYKVGLLHIFFIILMQILTIRVYFITYFDRQFFLFLFTKWRVINYFLL